ncbi:flagellar hook-basal body complex protein FliE [Paenibacillus pinihumi]|uniref:flagellar hook-basal body complex protein FliE n=1 Tax=Paenibacillus pinihumi TaxID=669462 RepID=UPI000400B3B2|nr:flagellar hook-basal body complex protein FliE [Paenibacillus pinihumi]
MIENVKAGLSPFSSAIKATTEVKKGENTPAEVTANFGDFLKKAIDGVSEQEKAVHKVTDRFIIGQADVSEVMVVSEQAQLSLQLTAQIRNKVVEAYQEMMRMQV